LLYSHYHVASMITIGGLRMHDAMVELLGEDTAFIASFLP